MAGMDDVDWNGDVGGAAEAGLALPGTLVAVTGTAALRPTICGTKLPVGMSVLAEVASGRRQPMLASDATLSRRANATFSDAQTHSHSDSSSARCPFFFGPTRPLLDCK